MSARSTWCYTTHEICVFEGDGASPGAVRPTLDVLRRRRTPYFAGDLLSGVGAGAAGGLGVTPSGCYDADAAYFDPTHGTAPDAAGEDVVNPTATMRSAAMMLASLGEAVAERL